VSTPLAKIVAEADAVLVSAQPDENGDPVLGALADKLAAAENLRWIGYLSTIGVYGDHDGAWIDETPSAGRPASARASVWRSSRTGSLSASAAASRCRSSASRAFTAPAATRSPNCGAAPPTGWSSPARSSTASMSTISPVC
jgi:hypothetical protein